MDRRNVVVGAIAALVIVAFGAVALFTSSDEPATMPLPSATATEAVASSTTSSVPPTTTVPTTSARGELTTYRTAGRDFEVTHPDTWTRFPLGLTSELGWQAFTLSTSGARAGADTCPIVPQIAISEMSASDALVHIQFPDWFNDGSYAPWPGRFTNATLTVPDAEPSLVGCVDDPDVVLLYGEYDLDGRLVVVMVALGPEAPKETRDEVWAILDSFGLLAEPTLPPAANRDLFDGAQNVLIDPGPLTARAGHSVVWTGSEMIVWGGWRDEVGEDGRYSDGAAYNPETDTWRTIADSPIAARWRHIAVWTGQEMLVLGGSAARGQAAYDPATDTWRETADPPVPVGLVDPEQTAFVWTGEALVVWYVPSDVVAAYDPAADVWTTLPETGLGGSLGSLRAVGSDLYALAIEHPRFLVANPLKTARLEGDVWRYLPDVDFSKGEHSISATPFLAAAVDGALVAWSTGGEEGRVVMLRNDADDWIDLEGTTIGSCEGMPEPVPVAGGFLAVGCNGTSHYDVGRNEWTLLSVDGYPEARYTVWANGQVLNWGDICCYGAGRRAFEITAWRLEVPI